MVLETHNCALSGLDPLLSIEELAKYLDVSVTTLRDWRTDGEAPCAIKVGGRVRFATAIVATAVRPRDLASLWYLRVSALLVIGCRLSRPSSSLAAAHHWCPGTDPSTVS